MAPPILLFLLLLLLLSAASTASTSCRATCGSLPIKYPFGTGPGCGSPLFHPYITCLSTAAGEQLFLTTHTGSYPITSLSYTTSTLTVTPPSMSTCSHTVVPTNNNFFGLDWTSPFSIASSSSTFLLLSCQPPTASLTVNNVPICDTSYDHLCAAMYTCHSIVSSSSLRLPTNTCCVYAPANLDARGELNLRALRCGAYASVVSLGDDPTDPARWEYGVAVKYSYAGDALYGGGGGGGGGKCESCEISGGICGYGLPGNSFLCVCRGGFNTSLDCRSPNQDPDFIWGSDSSMSTCTCVTAFAFFFLCSFLWLS